MEELSAADTAEQGPGPYQESMKAIKEGSFDVAKQLRASLDSRDQRFFDRELQAAEEGRKLLDAGDIPGAEACIRESIHADVRDSLDRLLAAKKKELGIKDVPAAPVKEAAQAAANGAKKTPGRKPKKHTPSLSWEAFAPLLSRRIELPRGDAAQIGHLMGKLYAAVGTAVEGMTESDALVLLLVLYMSGNQRMSLSLDEATDITYLKESPIRSSMRRMKKRLAAMGFTGSVMGDQVIIAPINEEK